MNFLDTPGDKYEGFVSNRVLHIHELRATLRELVHLPTGAQVMHIENNDPENLFCLSFKTWPKNSDGVAHILEHTVLCGSKKFPIKDPFFSMTRRSLNTFMNAMTGSDFTCYPAASQVEQDFYNLFNVYLDAVFHPLLKEVSFLQEGHRLEFTKPTDPKSALEIKGIVFNEMKGNLSSPDSRLWYAMMANLLPDLPYAYNYGGDPKVIPELTYEDLLNFHKTYYHPSRCLFFFYGNLPLKRHLDVLLETVLKNVDKVGPLPDLPRQKRFKQPVFKEVPYPVNETENLEEKETFAFGWLTAPIVDQMEVLALSILDSVLMETDASLLKRRLLESKLCIQADCYIDIEMSEVPFVIVCKGCKREHFEKLKQVLMDSLKEIVKEKIPPRLIEAAIHQQEFIRTEITGDQAPFGLTLFMRSALAKQHGCNPENALTIHSLFQELIKLTQDPSYLTGLIEKHLLNNPHAVHIALTPDPELSAREDHEEKQLLEKKKQVLTAEETKKILATAKLLKTYQQETKNQDLSCLPKVTLKDVPKLSRDFPLKVETQGNLTTYFHDCFTNKILYVDLIFDLPDIAREDLIYVQLFTTLLSEIGAGKRTYAENLEFLVANTGGVSASCALHVQASDVTKMRPALHLKGKALFRKRKELFTVLKDMILEPRFDDAKRIEELIRQISTSMENQFNRNAMKYAVQLALSGSSQANYISNAWQGLDAYYVLQDIRKNLSKKLPHIVEKLLSLKQLLFGVGPKDLVLSCDDEMYEQLKKESFFGLSELPSKPVKLWTPHYPLPVVTSQARPISSSVSFTVEAFRASGYAHPDSPALNLASHLFDNKILHEEVREKGGAYGSGATYNAQTGNYYLYSYRDPHIARTLKTFGEAIDLLSQKQWSASDLEEAQLGLIQQFDAPVAPGSRAMTAYHWHRSGKSLPMRQHYRDRLLDATPEEVQLVVQKELLPQKETGIVVTFANQELIEKENAQLSTKLPIVSN